MGFSIAIEEQAAVDIYWLVGAIIGSGLFIAFGGAPARRLVAVVARQGGRPQRRG